MNSDHEGIAATPHLTMPDCDWEQAQTQERIVARLAEHDKVGVNATDAAAGQLGVFRREILPTPQTLSTRLGLVVTRDFEWCFLNPSQARMARRCRRICQSRRSATTRVSTPRRASQHYVKNWRSPDRPYTGMSRRLVSCARMDGKFSQADEPSPER